MGLDLLNLFELVPGFDLEQMPTLDLSQDYLLFDNLESVLYYTRTGDSSFSSAVTIANCKFWCTEKDYLSEDQRHDIESFTIWQHEIDISSDATIVPKRGDKITCLAKTYIVDNVERDYDLSKSHRLRVYAITNPSEES